MYTYTVTIGRNVSGTSTPMSDIAWETFVDCVAEVLTNAAHERQVECLEIHRGTGVWCGVEEESAKVTLILKSALPEYDDSAKDVLSIRSHLHVLAETYHQDAVALAIGQSELISGLREDFTPETFSLARQPRW